MRNVVQPTVFGLTPFILGIQLIEPGFGDCQGVCLTWEPAGSCDCEWGEVKEPLGWNSCWNVLGRTVDSFMAFSLRFFLHRAIIFMLVPVFVYLVPVSAVGFNLFHRIYCCHWLLELLCCLHFTLLCCSCSWCMQFDFQDHQNPSNKIRKGRGAQGKKAIKIQDDGTATNVVETVVLYHHSSFIITSYHRNHLHLREAAAGTRINKCHPLHAYHYPHTEHSVEACSSTKASQVWSHLNLNHPISRNRPTNASSSAVSATAWYQLPTLKT